MVVCESVTAPAGGRDREAPAQLMLAARSSNLTTQSAQRGRPGPWDNFFISLALIGIFPLLPLLLQLLINNGLTVDALTLTAVIYSVTIAVATNKAALFVGGFVVALFEAVLYGLDLNVAPNSHLVSAHIIGLTVSGSNSSPPSHCGLVMLAIGLLLLSFIIERLFRHVRNKEEFFEFLKKAGA